MFKRTMVSIVLLFAGATGAQAAPLGLTLLDTPDIFSSFIDVVYLAGSDSFSANGFALQFDDGSSNAIAGGLFTLDATIDEFGNLSAGTFTISGTIAGLGFNSGTLLTGNLTAFGFINGGGDPLEFLFDVTGGDAAALYGGAGGIILSQVGFDGDWSSDFDNRFNGIPGTGQGLADAAAVPLPAAVWLMLSGLMGLLATARRSR